MCCLLWPVTVNCACDYECLRRTRPVPESSRQLLAALLHVKQSNKRGWCFVAHTQKSFCLCAHVGLLHVKRGFVAGALLVERVIRFCVPHSVPFGPVLCLSVCVQIVRLCMDVARG